MKKHELLQVFVGILALLASGCRMTSLPAPEPPVTPEGHFVLRNQTMWLALPDPTMAAPYYQGQRFTLPGMVVAAEWNGIPLFTERGLPERNPRFHEHVGGTADEYDIGGPQGYEATEAGESFMKIGVGLLTRLDDKPYRIFRTYPVVQLAGNEVAWHDAESIRFIQTLREETGERAYRLQVTVNLMESGFAIERRLRNLGRTPIETEHYSHNFSKIGNHEIGPGTLVTWPSEVDIASANTSEGDMVASPTGVSFVRVPAKYFDVSSAPGSGLAAHQPLSLTQQESGITMEIRVDRPLHRIAVWGFAGLICPEPFVLLRVVPGDEVAWTTTYLFRRNRVEF